MKQQSRVALSGQFSNDGRGSADTKPLLIILMMDDDKLYGVVNFSVKYWL